MCPFPSGVKRLAAIHVNWPSSSFQDLHDGKWKTRQQEQLVPQYQSLGVTDVAKKLTWTSAPVRLASLFDNFQQSWQWTIVQSTEQLSLTPLCWQLDMAQGLDKEMSRLSISTHTRGTRLNIVQRCLHIYDSRETAMCCCYVKESNWKAYVFPRASLS